MKVIVILVLAALLVAVSYFFLGNREAAQPKPAPQAAVAPPADQGPRHPLPESTETTPMPKLGESDPAIGDALASLIGADAFKRFLVPEDLVRRIVATLDNLPREAYAARLNPIAPVGGMLRTTGSDDNLAIAPDNSMRYAAYVRFVESLDAKGLAALYKRFYPLFQKAYVDLGYPNGYFNDRLVEVIDNLLEAPEVPPSAKLVAPHVLYEYADPELERRPAGQKALMRIGNDNARKVKAKLREIRREIIAAP
jgi:hypothetical protein